MYGTGSLEKPELGGKLPNKYKNKRNTAVLKIMYRQHFVKKRDQNYH